MIRFDKMSAMVIKIAHEKQKEGLKTSKKIPFYTLHIMYESMAPELPINEPTIVISELSNMNPSAHSAQPE